ncbi:MAG: iron-sulfur cluster assembly scaffold protein [Deltaproteobacteria bacterium]|nr:iron-sulfur cluster assembly scaffold protein [Deltaproteobacteria bacterium]
MSAESLEELAGEVGERFLDHALNPRGQGLLAGEQGRARGVGTCGDSLEVTIQVAQGRIREIGVEPHGCFFTVACGSALAVLAQGRELEAALELEAGDLDRELDGLPEDHLHCARLAVNTLGEAIEDYLRRERAPRALP